MEKTLKVSNFLGYLTVYLITSTEEYLLANEEWKYDKIPEILDGKNIADYVDPDILEMLDRLEEEEEERIKELENEMDDEVIQNFLFIFIMS